jgi:hypothetical protein
MALSEKLGKLVDVILSRKVVANIKTAEGEGGSSGGGGSPAMSVSVEDQGEIVNLERKPGDFDKKEEKFHDKLKEDLNEIKDSATKERKASDASPVSDTGDAPFDYLVSLMTNDTGMTVDRAIDETKKVFYKPSGAPTDVATALASLEEDIMAEETSNKISEMEYAGASFRPGPSKYIARVYAMFMDGEKNLLDVEIEPNDLMSVEG